MTYLSEARQDLYNKIFEWEHREDAPMSRFLTPKHGYHAGEETTLDPVEFTMAKVGYLTEISVTYRTGKNESKTFHAQVPDNLIDETVKEMLSRRSITYPG